MVAYTTTYSLAKPTVGDDEDVWGGYLNGNFDTIESLLKGTTSLTSLSLTGNITFGDNDKAVFGAGSDLVIYHDGTHSNIENGTGSLHIRNNTGGQLKLQAVSGEQSLVANANGSVELYHDNSKKIETQSSGVNITGTAQADRFLADTGGGMLRRYQSTWSYPTHDIIHSGYLSAIGDYVYLKAAGNSGDNHGQLIVADNGIYFGKTNAETGAATNSATAPFDNTTYGYFNSSGLSVTGNVTVSGTVDGRDIATDGTKLDGIEASADVTDTANVTAAGALMTTGGTLTGTLNFGDNVKAQFGASADLAIFHDGSNSYIQEFGTGNLILGAGNAFEVRSSDNVTTGAVFNAYGSVDLNHNGSTKLSTTSTGIDVTGTVVADGAQIDLSSSRQIKTQIATSGSSYGAITCVEPSASNLRGLELEGQLLRFGTNAYNQTTSVRRMQINDAGEAIFYEDTGADAKMRWNPTSEQLKFEDNVKATFGASDDLQIYHDGSQSVIRDVGTGQLLLQGSNTIALTTSGNVNLLRLVTGGAVTAYHNGSEKLSTTSTGIDVTGNVVVSGTVDGRDVASDGSKLDGIESGATADQTASEILTAIKTVDGAGSGLDADTVDGIQASSFLRSDTNDNISSPFNLDFSTSNTSNYIPADNPTALAVAPFSALAWHDVFAFNRYYSASQEEWNGSAWSSTTLDDALFAQKENQAITVASGSTITKVRWNFTGTSWIQPQWLAIGFTYVAGGASKTVTVESSSDGGSTWTTRHSSTTTANGKVVHFKLSDWSGDADVRITIDRNDTNALKMSYMSLLTARSGDQGKGKEAQLPFGWDADKNLSMEGNLLFGDNEKAVFGNGSDFSIYSDGNNAVINEVSSTGSLLLQGSHTRIKTGNGAETMAEFISDGAVTLYYDNSAKIATTSSGVNVTGVLDVSSRVESDDYRSATNQQIQIQAGESFLYSTGQTGEYVYLNGDNGVQINCSPDNWASGWAGRDTFTFSSSGFQFPDGTTQTTAAPSATQDYGLITGSVTLTNDYGALS